MIKSLDKKTKQQMHQKIMDAFNYQATLAIGGNTTSYEGDLSAAKALASMTDNVISLGQAPAEDIIHISETLTKAWDFYVEVCNDKLSSTAGEAFYAQGSTYLCDAIIALDRYAQKKGLTGPIQ